MKPNDFLMLISIVLAIVTIASANNKKIWLYKFNRNTSIIILLLYVILINYLIFYNDFRSRGWYLAFLECDSGIECANIAYILSVVSVFAIIIYVAKCNYFPTSRHNELLQYYNDIMYTNFPLLLEYINTYHKKELKKHINEINVWAKKEDSKDIYERIKDEREYEESSEKKAHEMIPLPIRILNDVILTKPFIDNAIKIAPFWYLELFSNLETTRIPNAEEMIQYYCVQLVKSNNFTFRQELDEMFKHDDKNVLELLQETNYLKLLYSDNYFITRFDIIQAIGEAALLEAKSRRILFSMETADDKEDLYHSSLCYQFVMLHILLYRYLAAMKEKNSVPKQSKEYEEYFFLHSNYIGWLYEEILGTYEVSREGTYADRLKTDIETWLEGTIEYCHNFFNTSQEPYDVPQDILSKIKARQKS